MDTKIVQSTKWSGLTELLSKLIVPFVNLFLARILAPEVFGVVATFTLITSFVEIFTDAGFQKYLVQHEFKSEQDRIDSTNVAFWTNFSFSCIIWMLIVIFRYPIASLVGSSGYEIEIVVMSLNIPMVALSSIQTALYRRDFRFKQLLPVRMITCAVPVVVTLPLAYILRNCWAIIIGALAKEIVFVVLLTLHSNWKPALYYDFKKLKEMLSFSMLMMADSFMIWFTSYAGTFVVSQFLNQYYVGIYKTGVTTITSYMNLIYTITAPVLFAGLSRVQHDEQKSKDIYYSFQKYCALLSIPLGVGAFVFRHFLTMLLLGSQWKEAELLIGGVALGLGFTIITAQYNSDFFRSRGKPHYALLAQTIYGVVMLLALMLAVRYSFTMLCVMRIALIFLYSVISTCIAQHVLKISWLQVLQNVAQPTIAALIMAVVGVLLRNMNASILWILISIAVCVVTYFAVLYMMPPSRKMLKGMWKQRRQLLKRG